MKQFNNFYSEVISLPNLYLAFNKAKKGKAKNKEYLKFCENLHSNLLELHLELLNKDYKPSKYLIFYLKDYKTRKIAAPSLRDHIVQHALFNYLEQIYESLFIFDSFACRKNKGTHKAFWRMRKFMRKHSQSDYFIKCDISKYFYSIDHYKLKSILSKRIKDKEVLWLLSQFIDSYKEEKLYSHVRNENCTIYGAVVDFTAFISEHPENLKQTAPFKVRYKKGFLDINNKEFKIQEKGIPIGSLLSQLFANIYLNELDYFVKQVLRVRHYVRYMDDFVIIEEDKSKILKLLSLMQEFLKKELLLLLENCKVQINLVSFGIDFVGYVGFKRAVRLRTRNYRRFNKKLKLCFFGLLDGKVREKYLLLSFKSYLGHISHTNSIVLGRRIIKTYFRLVVKLAVQRGGNWNNGANAGVFAGNLNNDATNTNNNIGFRCCQELKKDALFLRKQSQFGVQRPKPSSLIKYEKDENISRNTAEKSAIPAVTFFNDKYYSEKNE